MARNVFSALEFVDSVLMARIGARMSRIRLPRLPRFPRLTLGAVAAGCYA